MWRHKAPGGLAVLSTLACLLVMALLAPSGPVTEAAGQSVVPLKPFIETSEWQVDVTWHAKESFEDADASATLDLTATARYILTQRDRKATYGRWEVHNVQSSNLSYNSSMVWKQKPDRLEYAGQAGPLKMAVAVFRVGGTGSGYDVVLQAGFPVKQTPAIPFADTILFLATTQSDTASAGLSGPLPASGTTIHGSAVIPFPIGPFGASQAPKARLGIQYVIQPWVDPLAPLVPPKKK